MQAQNRYLDYLINPSFQGVSLTFSYYCLRNKQTEEDKQAIIFQI